MIRLTTAVLALALAGPTLAAPPAAKAPSVKPTPDTLTGVWTTASWTGLQRPKTAPGLVMTEAEAAAMHAKAEARQASGEGDPIGQASSEFGERGDGYLRVDGQIRSSWIVEPADGRLPYTEATRKEVEAYSAADGPGAYDNVEARPTGERCLTAEGAGAPILNSPDTNLITLVQTPGALVIVSEKNHDARIVPIGPAGPKPPPSWMGTSVGHWEGHTLVVETTNLRPGVIHLSDNVPLSDHARVVERFTRRGPGEIGYQFTVEDPTLYTRPWRAETVFLPAKGQMYEFACHEGNYALPGILAGGLKEGK